MIHCSELNAIDQIWKELKGKISANYQFPSIEEHAAEAEQWLLEVSAREALRKGGVLSKNYWLQAFF
jgi:hypothetical protein